MREECDSLGGTLVVVKEAFEIVDRTFDPGGWGGHRMKGLRRGMSCPTGDWSGVVGGERVWGGAEERGENGHG